MGPIPLDATHWDSGDWIVWHRTGVQKPELPCAAIGDRNAKLTLLQVSLLSAASSHYELTGLHLEIYERIARVHAALHFGIPLSGRSPLDESGVLLATMRPDAQALSVEVDMSLPFTSVLVVRINDQFDIEARMITRRALGAKAEGMKEIKWRQLPRRR